MGSNFIRYILEHFSGTRVTNLDLLTYAGNAENLLGVPSARYTFVRGDIADESLAIQLMKKADFVVNFAAETHVDRSIHGGSDAFIHSNIVGTHSLLKAIGASPNVKKMIQVSTDEVWGDLPINSKKKFTVNAPLLPNSPYAASKAAAELLIRSYVKTYRVPVVVSRSVNNFGPRQFPEKLIPFFTLRALEDKPLPLYGDGTNRREWLYVDDHTTALLTLLQKGDIGGVYGVSSGEEYSNRAIAKKILGILDKPKSLISFVKDRPAHDRKYAVDAYELRRLGWKPDYSLETELPEVIEWYVQNPKWIANVIRKKVAINAHLR